MAVQVLLLVTALCLDSFAASIAYGINKTMVSRGQIGVINGICSLCLGFSLLIGSWIDSWIPEKFTRGICFFTLFLMGCIKLGDSGIRKYYSNPVKDDKDRKQRLSWKEVMFLSLAMSVDSLFSGMMVAFLKIPILLTVTAAFIMGEIAMYSGLWMGRKISSSPKDISWIGGIIFIILAVSKL